MKLQWKNIVITGASSGIGEEIAYLVAKKGGTPILIARSEDRLKRVSSTIKEKYHIDSPYYVLDVQQLEKIDETIQHITNKVGTIHVLINNAGFGVFDAVENINLHDMKSMFEVNVCGLIGMTKSVIPFMLQQNEGHIINVASQAGKIASPKSSVYSATKHAVLGFTNSLRMELNMTNIHVTSVNPGPIRTRFFDTADKSGNYVKNVQRYMLDSEYVAGKIVDAIYTQKREINLPKWMNAGSVLFQLFPSFMEKTAGKVVFKK
ncbi:SDR family NAD(P)-dependent oxidoreductase [Bacillus suaedaesalsae]|uniref:SDR family oxidoreductase n=1 Tax=Bacillus suaedaesalsae TaxID=2810349 RepID=A0ABS2DG35_9BACI|nr:SDR family oxidoreductase [Bacillus suaedaesalsae]MBM6617397.1 SDR family oxidoreductase [Bacillus suaedaesalsae]